jgi:hypothetical protein
MLDYEQNVEPVQHYRVDAEEVRGENAVCARAALPGRSWTPTPQPALPKAAEDERKKDQPAVGRHSLTGPVLSGMTMPHCELGIGQPATRRIPAAFSELTLAISPK